MNVRRVPSVTAWLCTVLLLTSRPAFAQAAQQGAAAAPGVAGVTDDHALVQQLLARVADLEQQVKTLQGRAGAPGDTPGAETAPPAQAEAHEMPTPAGLGRLQIRGFSDIDFRAAQVDAPNTFKIGQVDLFLTSKLAADFSAISEVVFEAGGNNAFGVDIERILLQYSPSDYFNVGVGRYHTAIGYYNAAYHHGNWFQTTTGRPFIYRFEDDGGILPVHGVGVTVQGKIPSGAAGLRYIAEVSNGRASASPDAEAVQNVADENRGKAFNLGLLSRPDAVPGLQMGVSVYRDRLTPQGQPAIGETITAAHVVYQTPLFEQLNEAIFIRHAPENAASASTTTSAYTQISRQVGRYRPFFRYEYLNVPTADLVFGDVMGRLYGPSVGLKFDAAAPVAIKLQYDRLTGKIRNLTNGLTAQLAFTF